jgi:hypothetical protein
VAVAKSRIFPAQIIEVSRPDGSILPVEVDHFSLSLFHYKGNSPQMEPTGLAVGVFAIAGLFNNAVDCFEYVQLGRNFETDFTTCILKLDDTKLQLSRWGQAVGLSGDLRNTEKLNRIFGAGETRNLVAERLRHILGLFTDAENISHEFQSDKNSNKNTSQSCNELDPAIRSLRDKLRNLSVGRQNVTPLKRKAKWALYEEKHFRELVDDIKSTVDRLIDLFSSADSIQKLCDQEAAEIVTHETRQVLKGIVAEQDRLLEVAINRMMDHQVSIPGILCLNWRFCSEAYISLI